MAIKPKKVLGNEQDIANRIKTVRADKARQKASGLVGTKMTAAPARATSKGKDLKDLKPLPRKNGAETVKSAAKNVPAIKKELAKKANKPNAVEKLVQDVTNRYRVTAREARDIVTAVSTAAQYRNNENQGSYSDMKKDIGTQIKEVGKAAITGKRQTKPLQVQSGVITRNPKPKAK